MHPYPTCLTPGKKSLGGKLSGPLSTTIASGSGRLHPIPSTTRTTRLPLRDVSTSMPKHSRLKSSMMFKVRKRLPSQKLSVVKSSDHLLFGPFGAGMGALKPMPLRFLFLRLGSCNSSSRYKRSTLLWFIAPKSRRIRMVSLGLPNRGRSAASFRSRSRIVSSSFFFSLYLYVFRFCPTRLHALRFPGVCHQSLDQRGICYVLRMAESE